MIKRIRGDRLIRSEFTRHEEILRREINRLEHRIESYTSAPERAHSSSSDASVHVRVSPLDSPQVSDVLKSVWNENDNEAYRRDMSHWRGSAERWQPERWEKIGVANLRLLNEYREFLNSRHPGAPEMAKVLEWGPGGGSNLYSLKPVCDELYGVDISTENLKESTRVLAELKGATFSAVHLDGHPSSIKAQIGALVETIISTAVFQHFPSKQYGREVVKTMFELACPLAVGLIQIRFDNGNPKYTSKSVAEYEQSHLTATSYAVDEFWDLLQEQGFIPTDVSNLNSEINYATFRFYKPAA